MHNFTNQHITELIIIEHLCGIINYRVTELHIHASLRERDMDTARHSRADPSYPPIETDPVISKVVTSFRNHDEQRGLSRDDPFSWPSATTPDSLNRAPGPPGSFHFSTARLRPLVRGK